MVELCIQCSSAIDFMQLYKIYALQCTVILHVSTTIQR